MNKRVFPEGFHEFMLSTTNLRLCECSQLASMIYGEGYSQAVIKNYRLNHKIRSTYHGERQSNLLGVADYIENHCYGLNLYETADKVNEFYGCQKIDAAGVRSLRRNFNLPSGTDGKFKPGNVSHNKGVKMSPEMYEKLKPSFFKKGQLPPNYLPVGSIVINTEGYLTVKVSDEGKTWERWRFVHRMIYEKYVSEIPEGHTVIFKDGNKLNLSLDNLVCMSKEEAAAFNKYRDLSPEVKDAAVSLVKLQQAIKKKQ